MDEIQLKKNKEKQNQKTEEKNVMVCVTRQRTCARLIAYGADLADKMGYGLVVAHSIPPASSMLDLGNEAEALEYLSTLAYSYDGQMSVLRCTDALQGLADCARQNNAEIVILGASPQNATDVSKRFRFLLPEASFIVLDTSKQDATGDPDISYNDMKAYQ